MRNRRFATCFQVIVLVFLTMQSGCCMNGCCDPLIGEWAVHEFEFLFGGQNTLSRGGITFDVGCSYELVWQFCDDCTAVVQAYDVWDTTSFVLSPEDKCGVVFHSPISSVMASPSAIRNADVGFFLGVKRSERENPLLEGSYTYWGFYHATSDREAIPMFGRIDFHGATSTIHVLETAVRQDSPPWVENEYEGNYVVDTSSKVAFAYDGRTVEGTISLNDEVLVFSDTSQESTGLVGIFLATKLLDGRPPLTEADLDGTYKLVRYVQAFTPVRDSRCKEGVIQTDLVTFDGNGSMHLEIEGDEYHGVYSIDPLGGLIDCDISGLTLTTGSMAYTKDVVVLTNIPDSLEENLEICVAFKEL